MNPPPDGRHEHEDPAPVNGESEETRTRLDEPAVGLLILWEIGKLIAQRAAGHP
jgi:hypothetical protein